MHTHTHKRTEESTHRRAQRRKTDSKTGKHTLCELEQAKRTWACHKNHFVWKFRGKMLHTLPAHGICARLRSRNARGNFTRSIFCGNLQEKNPHTTPPTSIEHRAFSSYRKNPFSVATLFGEKTCRYSKWLLFLSTFSTMTMVNQNVMKISGKSHKNLSKMLKPQTSTAAAARPPSSGALGSPRASLARSACRRLARRAPQQGRS